MAKKYRVEPLYIPHEARRFSGFRAMLEVAQQPGKSYMYGALGMYMFSHAVWLAKEMQRGGFDRIVFLARDGYWVKRAYDVVAPALGVHVPSDYVRISRQAAFPLHFRQAGDLAHMADWVDVTAHTPETLNRLLAPDLRVEEMPSLMARYGVKKDERLTYGVPDGLLEAWSEAWDQERADQYREHARVYIAPKFSGKCATFDVGYNLRSEAVIRDLTGADVTAFITHTDSDLPDRRGVPYRTLYPVSPWVSWAVRERFLLEDAPLCVGYDENGPVMEMVQDPKAPLWQGTYRRPDTIPQTLADAFVNDMIAAHGEHLSQLHFRPQDGCAPFEWFLHCSDRRTIRAFARSAFENDFHDGAKGEDSFCLQWRLMQTDLLVARGMPAWRVRLRRALIRLQEDPRSFWRKLNPFASE